MTKIGKFLFLLTAVVVLACSAPCWAGQPGTFAKALKNDFCSGTSGSEWYGCYAYMHYRVDLVKNKEGAKGTCYRNGCGSKYSNPIDIENCKKGCDKAYNADN